MLRESAIANSDRVMGTASMARARYSMACDGIESLLRAHAGCVPSAACSGNVEASVETDSVSDKRLIFGDWHRLSRYELRHATVSRTHRDELRWGTHRCAATIVNGGAIALGMLSRTRALGLPGSESRRWCINSTVETQPRFRNLVR